MLRAWRVFTDVNAGQIYGGRGDGAAAVTNEVDDSSTITLGHIKISVLYTPCHTPGHVCYVADGQDGKAKAVFTGDTMFVAGKDVSVHGQARLAASPLADVLGVLVVLVVLVVLAVCRLRQLQPRHAAADVRCAD